MRACPGAAFVGSIAWAAVLAAALVPTPATAADDTTSYPDRPLSLVVAYGPGGATDLQARIVTGLAEEYLGQPIAVVNMPGAGGQIGWNWVIERGSRDGYTLTAYNLPHLVAQSIVFRTKFGPGNIEPIANWGADPAVLIVGADSPFDDARDLIAFAADHPGEATVSGAGLYTGHHVAALQLEQAAGVRLDFEPARTGGVEALQRVIDGEVTAGFNNLGDAFRHRDEVKILAVADRERHEFLPDVPTFRELGLDIGAGSVNYRGIAVPAGTPPWVIDVLAAKLPAMFEDPRVVERMRESGSPMRVLRRAEVQEIFREASDSLEGLLAELREGD